MDSRFFWTGKTMNSRVGLVHMVDQALSIVHKLESTEPDALWPAIEQELTRLKAVAQDDWPPSRYVVDTLWTGPYAAKNLEYSDPELANLLERIYDVCVKENTAN